LGPFEHCCTDYVLKEQISAHYLYPATKTSWK
jgi:hypothetical protein